MDLKGQATPEQIATWKEKYGKVFTYTCDGKIAYLRPVDRNTYAAAANKITTAGPAKFNEDVLKKIWLGGAEELRTEDRYYFGLIEHVEALMDKQKGELGEA